MIEKKLRAAQQKEAASRGGSSRRDSAPDASAAAWSAVSERRSERQEAVNKKRTEPKASALKRLKANRQEKQRKGRHWRRTVYMQFSEQLGRKSCRTKLHGKTM